jgi:hypothetical protein
MKTVDCPHCHQPINPAQLLGRLGKGGTKRFTPEQKAQMTARLAAGRLKLEARRLEEKKAAFTQIKPCTH